MGRGKGKLTLEDYERFLHDPNDVEFSRDQLNEIIFMHGFRKIYGQRKNVAFESLKEINLTKPHRSTLHESDIHSSRPYDALISLQQVKDDLEVLNWQECQVHSTVSVGLSKRANGCEDKSNVTTSSNVRRGKPKRKREGVQVTCNGDVSIDSDGKN